MPRRWGVTPYCEKRLHYVLTKCLKSYTRSNMRVLGIITARGGSKGIPKKNIAPLMGKPLRAYTGEAALRASQLRRIVLSTDDAEIAEVGRACGIEVPFLRPAHLAGDATPTVPV